MSNEKQNALNELFEIILKLDSIEDCQNFFNDLLTPNEEEIIAQRIQAVKLLKQHETYAKIIEQTGISNTTLSRVSKALQQGEGYKKFID